MCAESEHSQQGNSGFWIFESLFLALRNKYRCGCFPPTFNILFLLSERATSHLISLISAKGVGLTHAKIILVDLAFNVPIYVTNYPFLTVRGLVERSCKGRCKQTKISFRQTRTQANNDMTWVEFTITRKHLICRSRTTNKLTERATKRKHFSGQGGL